MSKYKDIPEHLLAGVLGTDALKWAEAFDEIIIDRGTKIDGELMLGWFANAIEQGKIR